jgi:hypothetical protein
MPRYPAAAEILDKEHYHDQQTGRLQPQNRLSRHSPGSIPLLPLRVGLLLCHSLDKHGG